MDRLVHRYNTRQQQQLETFEDASLSQPIHEEEEEDTIVTRIEVLGKEAFKTMTNFYPHEFRVLYAKVEPALTNRSRRGRQPTFGPLESFFLTLVMLHHYPKWHKFAIDWKCKTTNVIKNTITVN